MNKFWVNERPMKCVKQSYQLLTTKIKVATSHNTLTRTHAILSDHFLMVMPLGKHEQRTPCKRFSVSRVNSLKPKWIPMQRQACTRHLKWYSFGVPCNVSAQAWHAEPYSHTYARTRIRAYKQRYISRSLFVPAVRTHTWWVATYGTCCSVCVCVHETKGRCTECDKNARIQIAFRVRLCRNEYWYTFWNRFSNFYCCWCYCGCVSSSYESFLLCLLFDVTLHQMLLREIEWMKFLHFCWILKRHEKKKRERKTASKSKC